LAYAHLADRNSDEAAKLAIAASLLASAKGSPSAEAKFHSGCALRLLGDQPHAEQHLLDSIASACTEFDPARAGLAAQVLAAVLSSGSRTPEGLAWAAIAKECLIQHAPHLYRLYGELTTSPLVAPNPKVVSQLPKAYAILRETLDATKFGATADRLSIFDLDLYKFLNAVRTEKGKLIEQVALAPDIATQKKLCGSYANEELCSRLVYLWIGDLESIALQPLFPEILATTFLARKFGVSAAQLPQPEAILRSTIKTIPMQKGLTQPFMTWECESAWPAGLSQVFASLCACYNTAYVVLRKRIEPVEKEYPDSDFNVECRWFGSLPRAIQDRYSSYGFYDGGANSYFHLGTDIFRSVICDRRKNLVYLRKMGYSAEEVEELANSGFVGVSTSDLELTQALKPSELGSMRLDEFSKNNPPAESMGKPGSRPISGNGFLVDTNYHALFVARPVKDWALYGRNPELVHPSLAGLDLELEPVEYLRCKNFVVPVFQAASLDRLQTLVRRFRDAFNQDCYFRGQTTQYELPRKASVRRLLFGKDDIVEPSILGAAIRSATDYDMIHPVFQLLIQDRLYQLAEDSGRPMETVYQRWRELLISGQGTWDRCCMAIAQHYGMPTFGLDLTRSLEVAIWFATNMFKSLPSGRATYEPMSPERWPEKKQKWPIIYFVASTDSATENSIQDIHLLERVGLIALRPKRQKALFFMGAGIAYRNRLAEAVICAVRLSPGDWRTDLSYQHLFPTADEDPALELMLSLKKRFSTGPYATFFEKIPEYV
jgi:hypothetical protein